MTNFYVDDAVASSGSGASWSSAWKSFSDINWSEIKPGDTVYISGGNSSQTYSEPLTVGASGTAGDPITITAGVDPGHNGTVVIDGSNTSNATGVELDQNYVVVENITSQNWGASAFRADGATGSAFQGDTGNAGTAPGTESSSYAFEVRNTTNFTVQNNVGLTPSNMNIDSDTLFTTKNANLLVQGNHFTISNLSGGTNNHTDGWQSYEDISATFRQNAIDGTSGGDNNHGIVISDVVAGGALSVYNNVLDMGSGTPGNANGVPDIAYLREYLTSGYTGDVKFWNNTIYGGYAGYDAYETAGPLPAGDEFKNNIIYALHGTVAPYVFAGGNLATPENIDNNLVFTGGGPVANVAGTNETWASWQALGYDAHGVNADPKFTDAALQDFSISPASPAIDHGTALPAVTTDYVGTLRPQGAGYDIGAYEFIPSASAASPQPPGATLGAAPGTGTIAEGQDSPVGTPEISRTSLHPDGTGVAHGTAANEIIYASSSGQTLIGGGGDDIFVIRSHVNVTVIEAKPGISEVLTTAGVYTLPDGVDNLAATGHGAHILTGNAGNNVIYGSNGGDTLIGGGGNDELVVGTGQNTLTGGSGDNSFVFSSPKDHGNVITDFKPGLDIVDLRPLLSAIGYHGADAVADGYLLLGTDSHGNAVISVDPDGHAGSTTPHAVVTLLDVLPTSLHDGTNFLAHSGS